MRQQVPGNSLDPLNLLLTARILVGLMEVSWGAWHCLTHTSPLVHNYPLRPIDVLFSPKLTAIETDQNWRIARMAAMTIETSVEQFNDTNNLAGLKSFGAVATVATQRPTDQNVVVLKVNGVFHCCWYLRVQGPIVPRDNLRYVLEIFVPDSYSISKTISLNVGLDPAKILSGP